MATKKKFTVTPLILTIAIVIGFIASYCLGRDNSIKSILRGTSYKSASQKTTQVLNLSSSSDRKDQAFSNAQITIPLGYYATDDWMLTAYDSRGGMAPPRMILMKGYQVLNEGSSQDYYSKITSERDYNCIVIWSTNGFTSIDQWNQSITNFVGSLTDKKDITVRARKATMYTMVRKEGDVYVAFLPLHNADDTSYYFHTCNTRNKADFETVIQSILFRKDVLPQS